MKNDKLKFSPIASSSLYAWGNNSFGEYGNGEILNKYYPVEIYYSNTISSISNTNFLTLLVDNGSLYFMGKGSSRSGIGTSFNSFYVTPTLITGFGTSWTNASCSIYHCLAVYDSVTGLGYSWGSNIYGALGNGTISFTDSYYPTHNLGSNWDSLYAAFYASYGIKKDKTLYGWGTNNYGQLGQGNLSNYYSPQQIGVFNDWNSFSCKYFHCAAIRDTGILYTWGYNGFGQLGNGNTTSQYSPVQVGAYTDWEMVSAGFDHTLAIRNGQLYAFGNNDHGQLGDGTLISKSTPVQIGVDNDWEYVEASMSYSIAIKNGELYTWGRNTFANLGTQNYTEQLTPVKISNDNNFYLVSSNSDYTSFALRIVPSAPTTTTTTTTTHAPYELKAWGLNNNGVLGTQLAQTTLYNPYPISINYDNIANFKSIEQISAGNNFALFRIKTTDDNIKLYYSGGDVVSDGIRPFALSPNGCKFVATNGTTHVAVFQNGFNNVAYTWGNNDNLMLGYITQKTQVDFNESISDNSSGITTPNSQPWKKISFGTRHAVGVGEDGTLYQWGIATPYQQIYTPSRVSDYTDWVDAFAGQYTSIGLRSNGEVYIWGIKYGDLPPYNSYTDPVKVNILSNCKKINLTKATYFAIEGDNLNPQYGALYVWGLNNSFMCGSPAITGRDDPYLISYLGNWVDVKAGQNFAIASTKDLYNNVYYNYCWGENAGYVFGNGFDNTGSYVSTPNLNQYLNSFLFENINNISGNAVFALVPMVTTTTTTASPTSCFENWPAGISYSDASGTITGLTSGTIWNAGYGSENIILQLDPVPATQTLSYFYKGFTAITTFEAGELVVFSGFTDPNINGTYQFVGAISVGPATWHQIACVTVYPTTTTTTSTTTTQQPFQRQDLNAFVKLFYSGGLNNGDPKKSLGGEISSYTIKSGKNNIFDSIKGKVYSSGITDYRCVYLKNTSENRIFFLYFSLDDYFLGSIMDLGFNFVNEIQTITILNGPFVNGQNIVFSYKGNNFTVIYDTNLSTWVYNFNFAITQIEELQDVVVTGSSDGSNSVFEITFQGSSGYKSHPLITLVGYSLTPEPNISIIKSVEGSPINTLANKILYSTNVPTNITFYDAPITSPVYLPLLNPGDFIPIWLRRTIYANTIAIENDGCSFIISGNYEVVES